MSLPPDLQAKLEMDTVLRLGPDGRPLNPGNDYERHLYARALVGQGLTQAQVAQALLGLGLEDVPPNKRQSYVEDILHSVLVGFPNKEGDLLPAYQKVGGE